MTDSTVAGNTASFGGGIRQERGTLVLTGVTIGPNTAPFLPNAAGVEVTGFQATVTARDTVFESSCATFNSGTLSDGGGNVRDTTDAPGCPGTANDAVSTMLDPLGDYGGFTQTHRLQGMSPAIEAGSNATCAANDQRGVPRALSVGDPCDAGAFEVRTGTFPPIVLDIPDQTIDEDGSTGPLPLRFADTNAPSTGTNTVTITPSGPAALLSSTITQGGTFPNRTMAVQPPPDVSGGPLTVQVEVQATGGGSPTTVSFNMTVNPVNDAPVFALAGNPPAVNEDAGPQAVAGFASVMLPGPPAATDETGQTLTFHPSVTGTTGTLAFTTPPAIDPTTGNLTYQAVADANGTATVQVTLSDL